MSRPLSAGDLLMQVNDLQSSIEQKNTGVDASLSKILKKTFLNDKEDKTSHSDIKHSEKNLSKTDYFTALEYNMNKSCMGHALIINNEHFDDRLGMNTRHGTKVDGERLSKTLKSLGYTVHYMYNATFQQMKHSILNLARRTDHTNCNSFVMALMSHGDEGVIYSTDDCVDIKDFVDLFRGDNCPTLNGKPKIFIFQACRGQKHEVGLLDSTDSTDGVVTEEVINGRTVYVDRGVVPTVPAGADFLFCYSVANGFYSHRDTLHGSWYIQDLCKSIEQMILSKDNGDGERWEMTQVLTRVNQLVAERSVERSYNFDSIGKKQMPCFMSLLTKKLYFKKIVP